MTREELENRLMVLMGGRAAELLTFGILSTGAADDLAKATEIARSMATRFGMVPALGHMTYESDPAPLLPGGATGGHAYMHTYSDQSAHEVEAAIKEILERAFEGARAALASNRCVLETTATMLLERETLAEPELQQLFALAKTPAQTDEPRTGLRDVGASRKTSVS